MTQAYVMLHGVIRADTPPPAAAPAHDRFEGPEGLTLLASRIGGQADIDAVVAHNRLLCAYCDQHEVLPIRFGTTFQSTEAARSAIGRSADGYRRSLDSLERAAEFLVTVSRQSPEPAQPAAVPSTPGSNGRDYLISRARTRSARAMAQKDRSDRLNESVAVLSALARKSAIVQHGPTDQKPALVAEMAMLVPHDARSVFAEKVGDVALRLAELDHQLKVTGPWPAYSFAQIHDDPREGRA